MKPPRKPKRTPRKARTLRLVDWIGVSMAVTMIVGIVAGTINWRTASTTAIIVAATNSK